MKVEWVPAETNKHDTHATISRKEKNGVLWLSKFLPNLLGISYG